MDVYLGSLSAAVSFSLPPAAASQQPPELSGYHQHVIAAQVRCPGQCWRTRGAAPRRSPTMRTVQHHGSARSIGRHGFVTEPRILGQKGLAAKHKGANTFCGGV